MGEVGYSKVSEVEIYDFMSYSHARFVFDESNILNIKGYNDSGKSAFLRAIEICLADMYKRDQVKYIRHGSNYFRVVVTFDDGVSILREKYLNGQSLYQMFKDGQEIYSTYQGTRLTRIEGVPETIRNYLGLCLTDNGYLNFQSCSDKLLLVETTGSENYQTLNSALKSEELSRATVLLNADRNNLSSRIIELENELNEKSATLKSISDIDEEVISLLEWKESYFDTVQSKDSEVQGIKGLLEELKGVRLTPKVEEINPERLKEVDGILGVVSRLGSIQEYPEVTELEKERLVDIGSLLGLVDRAESLEVLPRVERLDREKVCDIEELLSLSEKVSGRIGEGLPEVKRVDRSKGEKIGYLTEMLNNLEKAVSLSSEINSLRSEKKSVSEEMGKINEEAKLTGVELFLCPNCGTYSEVPHTH